MIAYFTPGLGLSGGVRIILEHCQRLKDVGEDVVLINYTNNGSTKVDWFDTDVPIYTVNNVSERLVVRGLDTSQIDIIVACLWLGIDAIDKCSGLRDDVKKFYFIQGIDSLSYPDDLRAMQRKAYATYLRHDFTPLCVSGWLVEEVNERGKRDDAVYIPNGIDYEFWKQYKGKNREKILLIEGTTHDWHKDVKVALVVAETIKKFVDCQVWWVSKGDEDVPEFVDEYFFQPNREEMRDIMNKASVLIKTSLFEGWGLPHMEAMASGCAVLTTDSFGVRDLCQHRETAYITLQGDVRKLVNYGIILLEEFPERARIMTNADKVVKEFQWDPIIKNLRSVLYG